MSKTLLHDTHIKFRRYLRGFSIAETAVCVIIVGVMLVTVLTFVSGSKATQHRSAERHKGYLLAQQLMSEIMRQSYADPSVMNDARDYLINGGTNPSIGPDPGEAAPGNRSLFDDVDDYDGWTATPPQYKTGIDMANMDGWERTVAVKWVISSDPDSDALIETGAKHITVTVERNNIQMAKIIAIATIGMPVWEACCLDGGECENLTTDECTVASGTAQGVDTKCANATCPSTTLLFVVDDADSLTAQESAKKTLVESWGYSVTLISASDSQANFNTALADANVAYISETITGSELGTKLTSVSIGVVNEETSLIYDLGIASGAVATDSTTDVTIASTAHYITSTFALGALTVTSSAQPLAYVTTGLAPGTQVLATTASGNSLLVVDPGDYIFTRIKAPGGRAHISWGGTGFDINSLTDDGKTILQRALEWGASSGSVSCEDGICVAPLEFCSCVADCTTSPAASEVVNNTCDDGIDNDCDSNTDCLDSNCLADMDCFVAVSWGDGICSLGEDCNSSPGDCPGVFKSYCCGNFKLEAAEGNTSICDYNP